MRIFIAGATGVLGRRLVRRCCEHGHRVSGLARNPEAAALLRSLGAEACSADLFDTDALARAADGAEIIIHAATAIPTRSRPGAADWAMNDRIRRDGTRALAACAGRIQARHYVQQSIVWVARPPDGGDFDEDSPPHPNPVTQSALDAETIAREAGAQYGFSVAVLRCAWFYGPDCAHTRLLGQGLSCGKIPIIGKGEAVLSCLHVDDAAAAVTIAAESGRTGLWHVTDDTPVTVAAFLRRFAHALRARPPSHVPAWLARLVAGNYAVDFFTRSTRTGNARFREAFGWRPRFPDVGAGLDQVVQTWRAEGLLEPEAPILTKARFYALALILVHAGVALLHGVAHVMLDVPLSAAQHLFVWLVVVLAPLVAGGLLWRGFQRGGGGLLTVSMTGALLFGLYHHFMVPGSDHLGGIPDNDWGILFVFSAELLALSEGLGVLAGLWCLGKRPADGVYS